MVKDTDLKKLFNMVPGLVCIAGTDGYFELINPEWENVLGYSTEELKAHPFLEFIHPDDRMASQEEIEKLISGGKTLKFENPYLLHLLWGSILLIIFYILVFKWKDRLLNRFGQMEMVKKIL